MGDEGSKQSGAVDPAFRKDVWLRKLQTVGSGPALGPVGVSIQQPDGDYFLSFCCGERLPNGKRQSRAIAFFNEKSFSYYESPPSLQKDANFDYFLGERQKVEINAQERLVFIPGPLRFDSTAQSDLDQMFADFGSDECREPTSSYIERDLGVKVTRKAILYVFPHPVEVPSYGPCADPHRGDDSLAPPNNRMRVMIPEANGVLLPGKTILVTGSKYGVAMPVAFRLTPDLQSPAFDNKTLFLIDEAEVEAAKSRAVDNFYAAYCPMKKQTKALETCAYPHQPELRGMIEQELLNMLEKKRRH